MYKIIYNNQIIITKKIKLVFEDFVMKTRTSFTGIYLLEHLWFDGRRGFQFFFSQKLIMAPIKKIEFYIYFTFYRAKNLIFAFEI